MAPFKPDDVIFQALCDTLDFGRQSADVLTRNEAEEELWHRTQHILDCLKAEGYEITSRRRKGTQGKNGG